MFVFSWTFLRFWSKDSGIPTHGCSPKKGVLTECCQLWVKRCQGSDPFYWMRVILASNRGTLMEQLCWQMGRDFPVGWGEFCEFVTRLLRNLQNARVGGNSSWFYRYTCRCRLNTSNFSQHSGTGSFASQKILICQSDPGPMGPMVPIPGLEAGHLTHHHLWHGALDLWWAFSFLEKKPRWRETLNLFFLQIFQFEDFILQKRDVISSCEPNFGGSLDILSENRQVMQLLAGSRWGVCWKTRGGGW